jgi:hypothetical protein
MPTPQDRIAALNKLASTRVLIGIPSDDPARRLTMAQEGANMMRGGTAGHPTITNAALGYIHEFGSPARNIPARPFLRNGVEDSQPKWENYMQQAATAAMEGKDDVMDKALNAAGETAVLAVKAKIVAGIPPPIKPATMAARARHSGGSNAAERAERAATRAAYRGFHERYEAGLETSAAGAGVTPLIDTAQLLNSITYVVKKRGD